MGGKRTFPVDVKGMWILNTEQNSIQFTFISIMSKVAIDTKYPVSLTAGVQCVPEPSPSIGTLNLDKFSVVCVQANKFRDKINTTYKIWFRELDGYKIDLETVDKVKSSNVKSISVEKIATFGKITTVRISLNE